jgi:hypothetical protein
MTVRAALANGGAVPVRKESSAAEARAYATPHFTKMMLSAITNT